MKQGGNRRKEEEVLQQNQKTTSLYRSVSSPVIVSSYEKYMERREEVVVGGGGGGGGGGYGLPPLQHQQHSPDVASPSSPAINPGGYQERVSKGRKRPSRKTRQSSDGYGSSPDAHATSPPYPNGSYPPLLPSLPHACMVFLTRLLVLFGNIHIPPPPKVMAICNEGHSQSGEECGFHHNEAFA